MAGDGHLPIFMTKRDGRGEIDRTDGDGERRPIN